MLSPRQRGGYDHDGIVFPIPVLSAAEVAACRARFEELVTRHGERGPVRQPHLEYRWAYDLALHPRVLDAVEGVLGPDVVVYSALVFYKPPRDPGFVSWHQDGLYGHMPPTLTTAWIALTPSRPENGCLRVVPRSHREGLLPHREERTPENLLKRGQTIEDVDDRRAVNVVLEPGEMSLHHGDLVHGSNPNRSNGERIGFAVRYVTPDAAECPLPVIPARGRTDFTHLEILAEPPAAGS